MVKINRKLNERFIKNWITSVFGFGIVAVAIVMFWQSKINVGELMMIIPFGLAIAGIKYKKSTCSNNEQGTENN